MIKCITAGVPSMTELVSYNDRMNRMISGTLNIITSHCHPVLLDPVVLCTPKVC
jgi:hypothetical protein